MFKRKLTALEYQSEVDFNINDAREFRHIILWLEEQKIRHYKIEDREDLRQTEPDDWVKGYTKYKKDLACPVTSNNRAEELDWLLSYAIRLEYQDNIEKFKNVSKEEVKQVPQMVTSNPLDKLDFQSEEFKTGVNAFAKILNITQHPDHLITLKAISQVISKRLNSNVLEKPQEFILKGTPYPIQEADLGFDTGDYVLNMAAKVLRLLYIHDLRGLQTKVNECIVNVQQLTANPKTDTRLGQVGR